MKKLYTIIVLFLIIPLAGYNQTVKMEAPAGTIGCNGNPATLTFTIGPGTVGPNYEYYYSVDGGAWIMVTGNNPHSIAVTTAGTYVLEDCIDLATGFSVGVNNGQDTEIITEYPQATVAITPDPANTSIGASLTLNSNASGGTGTLAYNWTDGAVGNLLAPTNQTSVEFNSATSGSFVVSCQVTDDNSCIVTDNVTVTVIDLQAIISSPASPATACVGSPIALDGEVLNGSGNYSYNWSYSSAGTGSFSATNIQDPTFTPNTAVPYTLTFTVTDEGVVPNVSASTSIIVNSNALPTDKVVNVVNRCIPIDGSVTVVSSDVGVNYDLYEDVGGFIGPLAGTGGDITWTLGAGSYYIIATNASGCTNTFTGPYVIGAYFPPTVSPDTDDPDDIICQGTSVGLLSNAVAGDGAIDPTGYVWDNAATLTPTNTTANPTANPATTTTYSVTVTDEYGCFANGSIGVTVTPAPTVTILSADNPICVGESATLTATSDKVPASWDWDGGTLVGAGNPISDYTISPAATTSYDLVVTDATGCSTTETYTLTVNSVPTANAGLDQLMCLGAGATLSGSAVGGLAPYTFSWSGGTVVSPTDVDVNPSPSGIHPFTLTVVDANNCSDDDIMNVTVVDNPTVDAGLNQSSCSGDLVNLDANPLTGVAPYTYSWEGGAFVAASTYDVNPTNPIPGSAPSLVTYNVVVRDANNCTGTDNVDVTVNAYADIVISNDGEKYCNDAGVITLNATPTGGTWTELSGTIPMPGNTFDVALYVSGFYTFEYTYTGLGGCITTQQATIEILPYGTPDLTDILIDGEPLFCSTDAGPYTIEGQMTVDLAGQAGVTETFSGNGVTDLGNGTAEFNPVLAGVGVHTITYSVNTPGCSNTITEDVTVGTPVTYNNPVSMCVGEDDISLSASNTDGQWIITFIDDATSTTNVFGPYAHGDANAVLQAIEPGIYYISYELTNPGEYNCSDADSTRIYGLPSVSFTIDGKNHTDLDINFCENGSSVTLLGNQATNNVFSSVPDAVAGNQFDPTTGAGTYVITYTHTDINGCVDSVKSSVVTVNETPVVSIDNLSPTYCENDASFTITGSPLSGTAGFGNFTFPATWTNGKEYNDLGNATSTINPDSVSVTGGYNIIYEVTDLNGCLGSVTETIDINPIPTVDFNGLPATICQDADVVSLTGSPTDVNGTFTGDGINSTGPGTAEFDPSAATVGIHTITYTYLDPLTNCDNSISKDIEVLGLPNQYIITTPSGLNYCETTSGINIGISSSQAPAPDNFKYYLVQNNLTIVDSLIGDGNAMLFGSLYPAGNYKVVAQNNDGCQADFLNTITAIEDPAIADAGSVNGNTAVCADGTTIYTYSVSAIANAADHVWLTPIGIIVDADRDSVIDVIFDPSFAGGVIEVYGEDITSSCPAGASSTLNITINPSPSDLGAAIVGDDVVCESETGKLYSVDPLLFNNETAFEWETTSGVITSDPKAASIIVNYPVGSISGTLRVRATNSCTSSDWVTLPITVNSIPNVTIDALGVNDVIDCTAGSQVQLNASSTEDPADITAWQWTALNGGIILAGDENVQNPRVTNEGNFVVQIEVTKSGQACYFTDTVTVDSDKTPPTISIPGTYEIDCINTIETINATGDPDPATTYLWTGPAGGIVGPDNGTNVSVDIPGTYTLTATSLNGCTSSKNIIVVDDTNAPDLNVASALDITCTRTDVTISGSSPTADVYLWTRQSGTGNINNINASTTTVDGPGTFRLTVTTSANGCSSFDDVVVASNLTAPGLVVTNPAATEITCVNNQVQLEATAIAGATYSWSTGIAGASISDITVSNPLVDSAGIYTVTAAHPVTGCEESADVTVNRNLQKPVVNINPSALIIDCDITSIDLDASASLNATSFSWSTLDGSITNGSSTDVATISSAGTYTVVVTNGITGCEETGEVIITDDLSSPNVSITGGPYEITCTDPDPVLSATVDLGASVLWTGPGVITNETTTSPTVNASGTYIITATGSNGCTATDNVFVSLGNDLPNITIDTTTLDITCTRLEVDVTGTSNTPDVTFQWQMLTGGGNVTNSTSPTATVDAIGTYELTVTASNGCTNSDVVTVEENVTPPVITLPAVDDEILTCNQSTVTLDASATPLGSQFVWSTLTAGNITNPNSPNPTVDLSGDYTVTVTNPSNGCESTATTTVTDDLSVPTIIINAPGSQITCTNPTLVLDASTSLDAASYTWSASLGGNIVSDANTSQPTVNAAGRYTVTAVHNVTGCPASNFVDVTQDNSVPNIDVFNDNPGDITCSTGIITLSGDATGVINRILAWNTTDGNITSATDISNPTVNAAGTYVLTVTNDDTGCSTSRGVTVGNDTDGPTLNFDIPNDITCTELEVDLKVNATSTNGNPLTYMWTSGAGGNIVSGQTTATPTVDQNADYTVEVTDQGNGCISTSFVTVNIDTTKASVFVDETPDQITCDNATVVLDGSSGFTNVSYQWTTSGAGSVVNSTTQNPTVDAAGTYNLEVTNLDNGCVSTSNDVVVITNKTVPSVTVFAPSGDLTCTDTEVTISVSSNSDYTYSWTGIGNISNPTSNSTNVDAAGTYSVLVEDIYNGCETTYTIDVNEDSNKPTGPTISNTETCFGSPNPAFSVIAGNNVKWYADLTLSVYLSTGNSYTPVVSTAGTHSYYATSTGTNGCESLPVEITLTIHELPIAPTTVDNSICEGSAAEILTAVGTNINWYDNADVFIQSGSTYLPGVTIAGSYTYFATQTDAEGCESGKTAAVYTINSVPAQPVFTEPALEICETEANPVFNVIGDNVNWYKTVGGAIVSTGNSYQSNEILPGVYNIYSTQTVNGCQSPEATGTLTINPMPIIYNVQDGGAYCEGTTGADITLSNSENGVNYELWLDDVTLITDVAGNGGVISFGNQTQEGNYTVYGYNATTLCKYKMNGDVDVSMNPLPDNSPTINGSTEVCQTETGVVYSITPVNNAISYNWTVPVGFTIVSGDNSNSITVNIENTAASGNISVHAVNACGSGVESPILFVEVNPIPGAALNLTGPNVICNDVDGVTYSIDVDANATSYNWTLPQGATIVAGFGTRQVTLDFDNTAVNDIITVAPANACGEGTPASQMIMVNNLPFVDAGDQQDLCVDNTILDANTPGAGSTGVWDIYNGAATFSSLTDPLASITSIGEGNNRLVWTITDANGCTLSDTVLITNNTVIVEAGNNQVVCDEFINLSGSDVPTGAIGSWSATTGTANFSDGNIPNPVASGLGTGINILKWSVTKGGCTNYDTVMIDNQRPTEAYAGIDISVCGDSTYLGANNPVIGTGEWTVVVGAAIFEDVTQYNTKVSGLSQGENTLRWTITNGICSTSDEVKITNNKLSLNAGVDQVICDNTTTLDATAPLSGTAYWSVSSGSGLFVDPNSETTIVTGIAQGPNKYTWNVNNNGCISSDSLVITNNSPTDSYAGEDTIVTSEIITLQGNSPAIGTGFWTLISGSGTIVNPDTYNSTVTDLGFGQNIFRWTITNNSCISTDDVIITNYMSTETNAGPDQTICGSETNLSGSEPVLGYGEWSVVQGSALFEDPSNPYTKVSNLAKGSNTLKWSIWQNGWTSDEVIITNASPTDANAGLDQIICLDSTQLAGNNPIVGSGQWIIISGSATFEDDTLYNTRVTGLAKGENVFKWTITNESCSSSDIVVVRNDLPTIADAGVDQISCESTINLFPNTPTVGTGAWSVVSGSANFEGNVAKNMGKDVNVYRWTITNNACSSFDDVTITNHEPSDANAGADKVLCADSVTLSANIAVVGTSVWTIQSGSADVADFNSATTKVTNLSQGLNVFRWTVTYNSCVKIDEIVINNAYVEATVGPDQEICSETTILEANNPSAGIGTWSVLGGSGAAIFENANQPDTRVNGLDKGENILKWTITNEICSSSADVTINNSLPTEAFAGPDQELCLDNSILQGNTPIEGTGEWSILSGSADITTLTDPSSTVSNLDYGINTLRWTISKGNCVSTDEVVIANNSTLTSNAGLDQVLCVDSAILYANIPTYGVGTWSVITGSATFADNNDYNTKITNIGKGENNIRWVITNGSCTSSDEVLITNNAPTKSIAGADQTICGDSTYLQANVPEVGIGSWTLVSGAANFVVNTDNNTQVKNLNPGSNTLRWTIENNGCESFDDVVIYNDLPYKASAGDDFSICSNTSPLYANDPVVGLGEWTVVSGNATFNDPTRFDATVTALGFGANTLRWTINYASCTTYDEIVITNNKIDVYAGVDQVINESSTLLAASNPSTGQGQWIVIGGSGQFENQFEAITKVSNLGSGLNTFRWAVDIDNCISSDDVSVTYNVPPVASFVVTPTEGCPPLDVYFVNNSLDNLPFTWNFDDGETSNQITVKHTYTEPGIYKPTLTIVSGTGELITKDTIITVFDQPEASFLVVNQQVYIPEEEAIFINTSSHLETSNWEFGDGGTSTDNDPKYIYVQEGIFDVFLEVWSENNCYDSITVQNAVEVIESGVLKFPNAFTPNLSGSSGGYYNPNDFSNDVFYPIGDGISEYHLEIFNKWGILIFESKDINIGWDGYYQEKLVNEGVYVWKVRGKLNNGKEFKDIGTVLLLR